MRGKFGGNEKSRYLCGVGTNNKTIIMAKTYINILLAFKDTIQKNFGVSSLKLFGSVARNQEREDSDVDVCVEMEPDMLKRYALKEYLESILHKSVDVVRFRANMNPTLKSEIERDGILVF